MVAKPPGGKPGMAGDEPVPSVGTPAFLPQPAALPALSWLSTAALVADPSLIAPPESLRPAEPDPSLIAPPGRGTPVLGLLAEPACRAAAPPAHPRLVCFVCCIVSLLFCSYVLFAPGEPAASFSHFGSKLPLSHTFHEHSRVARPPDSHCQATRHVPFLSRFCGATPAHNMDTRAT